MTPGQKIQPNESVDAWVERQPLPDVLAELRRRLLALDPRPAEVVKWSQPWYVLRDHVFYLTCHARYATLGVCHGAVIDDPDNLLEGTGKRMRHVKVASTQQAASPALAALIARALARDAARDPGA